MTIKLYERYKILQSADISYKDFMTKHFGFIYNGRKCNIYEAIEIMRKEERDNINDKYYSLLEGGYTELNLYDFVYDMIPHSIRTHFLNTKENLKSYLPLKQDRFEYKENVFSDTRELSLEIYGCRNPDRGCDIERNGTIPNKLDTSLPKDWYILNALYLKDYPIDVTELVVPQAKLQNLGICYDELWEMINHIKPKEQFIKAVQGREYISYYESFTTTWLSEQERVKAIKIAEQERADFLHHNFLVDYRIFEGMRRKEISIEEQESTNKTELDFDLLSFPNVETLELRDAGYVAYRFNQALIMAFLNAYDNGDSKNNK